MTGRLVERLTRAQGKNSCALSASDAILERRREIIEEHVGRQEVPPPAVNRGRWSALAADAATVDTGAAFLILSRRRMW